MGEFNWSPDGTQFVCQFRKTDQAAIEREGDERKKKLGIVSRHITRMHYKYDGVGFLPEERWHIWTINARSGRAKQLTDGLDYDEKDPRWTPDGKQIVFFSNRSEDPEFDIEAIDLYAMPSDGGEIRNIVTPVGRKGNPSVSPDGTWVSYFGSEGRGNWWQDSHVWIVPLDGSGQARDLTDGFGLDVGASTINDVGGSVSMPPTWASDSSQIYFQVSRHGNTELMAVSINGDGPRSVIEGNGVVGAYTLDELQETVAYFYATSTDIGQIWSRQLSNGRSRKLTRFNQSLLQRTDLGEMEEFWFEGGAGNDLQGWILRPPGFDASKTYPSILEIHGGPLAQYGNMFMHEFYYLAAKGYVVYFCNPRGGQGYGEEHAKAIWNNWGTADYDDLMAWADFVQHQPYIDPERMGVTGGSYGGFMTNWIIGHTDRFKAAVTQRSVSNLIDFYGSTDENWIWEQVFGAEPPWANENSFQNYWRQSPIKYITNVKTPTLIIHSEQDLRCPIEQDEQVYVALKRLGVETEMVRFPEESHGLSRDGRTDRRVERLNHMVRWFDKYLK